jgi:dTDP-4-dehydrorhamnose 3,5-epimerase
MEIIETALPGVLVVIPAVFRDDRGTFSELWNLKGYEEAGLQAQWVQDNCSTSIRNVVRGIHYQVIRPQAKLVRVSHGRVLDVAVDLRRRSPYFGRHVAVELSAENGKMLYIPVGFGHAFAALTDDVGIAYKVGDYYSREGERTVLWNDPDLAIPWPISAQDAIISDKDANASRLRDAEVLP